MQLACHSDLFCRLPDELLIARHSRGCCPTVTPHYTTAEQRQAGNRCQGERSSNCVLAPVIPPACRFLGKSAVEMPQWAPFGDGGRNCVGMKLAVEEAKVRGSKFWPYSGQHQGRARDHGCQSLMAAGFVVVVWSAETGAAQAIIVTLQRSACGLLVDAPSTLPDCYAHSTGLHLRSTKPLQGG